MKTLIALIALVAFAASVQADDSVNDYIKMILENIKGQMTTGIPDMKIPVLDPLSIPKIDEHIKEGVADIKILVDQLKVDGLSKFDTRSVDADLQNLRLSLDLFIPQIAANAVYNLDGKIFNIIPLYGKGPAHVNVVDVTVSASAGLTITADGHLQAQEMKMDLKFGSIFCNLENILGGGSLGNLVNGVVTMLGKNIFDHFQPDIMRELNKVIRLELNKALKDVSLADIQGGLIPGGYRRDATLYDAGNANIFLDKLLVNARSEIKKDLDPIKLPEDKASFSKKILFVTVHGEARVYEGWLAGLSTIHRTGNAEMSTSNDEQTMMVSAHLGVSNLKGHYRAHAKFMSLGPSASATVSVSSVSVRIGVKQSFVPGSKPQLTNFNIERIGGISIHFSGLGPLDWIINLLTNLVGNLVKGAISNAIEKPLRSLIAEKLSQIDIPLGK